MDWPLSRFNPLPTRRPGERRRREVGVARRVRFQSAPDPKAGREKVWPETAQLHWMFQSAPDPKAGREAPLGLQPPRRLQFQSAPDPKAGRETHFSGSTTTREVSIRSRPEGRERVLPRPSRTALNVSIRSRPEGRERGARASKTGPSITVSIRSRPEGRERGEDLEIGPSHPRVSIRSRPEGRERVPIGGGLDRSVVFQSAPDPKAGREYRSAKPTWG